MIRLTVVGKDGACCNGYEVGQQFILDDFQRPPAQLCSSLMKSAYAVVYAIAHGAEFPFSENVRSLRVTCPEGGAVHWQVEVLDADGRVVSKPRPAVAPKASPKTLEVEVERVSGKCFYGYKPGDTIPLVGLKTPDGFCGAAYSCLFPTLFALNFGASFENGLPCRAAIACPDNGFVRFSVRRKD